MRRSAPTGARIITAGADGAANVWSVVGDLEVSLAAHEGGVRSAAFGPDGGSIATVSIAGEARVWNPDGTPRSDARRAHRRDRVGGLQPRRHANRHGQRRHNGEDLDLDGVLQSTLSAHTEEVVSAEYSPDGEWVVTASRDGRGGLWLPDGTRRFWLFGHTGPVASASFAPDGIRIVTASDDGSAGLWSLEARHPDQMVSSLLTTRPASGQSRPAVRSAAFSPYGGRVVTIAADGTATIWDATDGLRANLGDPISGHTDRVVATDVSPDGTLVATASMDGTAKVWDLDGNLQTTLVGHGNWLRAVEFSPDGTHILTAGYDGTARVWDLEGNQRAELQMSVFLWTAKFSPDGSRIVAANSAGGAAVLDLDRNVRVDLTDFGGGVFDTAFGPDGNLIVTTNASRGGGVRLWDVNGNLVRSIDSDATSAVFSPDGTRILTANLDGTATLFGLDGDLQRTLTGHTDEVTSAQFSPDGTRIVTASDDGTGKLWGLDGTLQATLFDPSFGGIGSANNIGPFFRPSAVFSSDGTRILTGGGKIWHLSGIQLASLGPQPLVSSMSLSPDGVHAVTTNAGAGFKRNNAAQVWRVYDNDALVDAVETRLRGRVLTNDQCLLYRIQPCPSTQ